MVGDLHKQRTEYAIKYFNLLNFRVITINGLETKLREICGKSKGIRPDLLMIWHDKINLDVSRDLPIIPTKILIKWIEIYEKNFQGFPLNNHASEAILRTLTMKDLYQPDQLRRGLFGQKIKTKAFLYEHLSEGFMFLIDFYLVQENGIWNCVQEIPITNLIYTSNLTYKKKKRLRIQMRK